MERSTAINTITLLFVVATMVVLLRTNNIPSFLLPSSNSHTTPASQLPATPKSPTVVTPGALKKPESQNPVQSASSEPSDFALTRKGIILETNKARVEHSVAKLTESSALDRSAQAKADDILARQYFAHTSPDGKTVSDLVAKQGYAYLKIGENLALGNFTDDADVVTAWMNSPGHRANILDPQFSEIGVGVARGLYQGRTIYVAVQHFGRPRSDCPGIDSSLKSQIDSMQKYLSELWNSLSTQKATIDQGSGSTSDINTLINAYNSAVALYKKVSAEAEALRAQYNAEVESFNTCLASPAN